MSDDIAAKVRAVIQENLNDVDESKLVDEAKFVEDLGADSLDIVELVMAFEEEFDIEIADDASESLQTVGQAVDFIRKATA